MSTSRPFVVAALLLLLPAASVAQSSYGSRDLQRGTIGCYDTACVVNPAGVHRFLKPLPDSQFTPIVPNRAMLDRGPGGTPTASPAPAKSSAPERLRKRLGRERLLGIEGKPPRGVLRGATPVIPRR